MTGIHSPYEVPENPDIVIHTANQSIEDSVEILWNQICEKALSKGTGICPRNIVPC
jgi:adenylylsulfate kinase-like enzyme